MLTTYSHSSEHRQALAKTASSYPASQFSPQALVRAVATRAYSLEMSDQELMIYLRSQVATHPGLDKFLKQHTPRKRLFASAKRAAVSSSPVGAAASGRQACRLMVGRLLGKIEMGTPTNAKGLKDEADLSDEEWAAAMLGAGEKTEVKAPSPARQLRARVALSAVGMDLLSSIQSDQGWNTIQLSYSRLALMTGWSPSTAKAALNDLVAWRLISELPSARMATARRFKMNRGLTPSQKKAAENNLDAIGALMGREGASSRTADLIKLATHSAWGYGSAPLGYRAWVVAAADASNIDPLTLAISKRNVALDRKALLAAGLVGAMSTEELTAVLDRFSREHGGLEAKRESEEAYRAAADARGEEVRFHQALKKDAGRIVEELVGPFATIPKPGVAGGRKLARWIETSREAFAGREYPVDLATAVQNEFGRLVGSRLRDAAAGKVVGGWITAGLVVDGEIPAKRMLAMKAARGLDHLGAGLMSIPGVKAEELEHKGFLRDLQGRLNALPAMSEGMRKAISEDLRARLVLLQWDTDKAVKGSVWAVRDVAIANAPVTIAA